MKIKHFKQTLSCIDFLGKKIISLVSAFGFFQRLQTNFTLEKHTTVVTGTKSTLLKAGAFLPW